MIEVRFPDKATLYDSPCANCAAKKTASGAGENPLLVSCDKFLCYEINEYSEKHPTVTITSG